MPAGPRIRANNVYGTVSDNPLTMAAVSMTSLGLSLLPAVSGQHAVLVLDPKRVFGDPEIVVVTSHLAMGTTATITRGQYGTSARDHPQGTAWAHVPVGPDDYTAIVTSGTRPSNPYEGQTIFETDTDFYMGYSGSAWEYETKLGQWIDYTPTWTQSATITHTINYSRYIRIGRTIIYQFNLTATGSGTAANTLLLTLPVTAAAGASLVVSGAARFFDTSSSTFWGCLVTEVSGNMGFFPLTTFGLGFQNLGLNTAVGGTTNFGAAVAAGDVLVGSVFLEST